MVANAEIELALARGISEVLHRIGLGILPDGYRCEARLHRDARKKRKDANFEGNWNPDVDSIRIVFSRIQEGIETAEEIETATGVSVASSKTKGKTEAEAEDRGTEEDRLSDLVRALDRAERRPGYEFVSLKWFRDNALVHERLSWAADEFARHDALREAIDRRWILTSKVANPRPPNFPVTAIRLNRQMPEVVALVGGRADTITTFRPVPIRGESLSSTVLRDRR